MRRLFAQKFKPLNRFLLTTEHGSEPEIYLSYLSTDYKQGTYYCRGLHGKMAQRMVSFLLWTRNHSRKELRRGQQFHFLTAFRVSFPPLPPFFAVEKYIFQQNKNGLCQQTVVTPNQKWTPAQLTANICFMSFFTSYAWRLWVQFQHVW